MTRLRSLTIICDDGTHEGCHDTYAWTATGAATGEAEVETHAAEAGWNGAWDHAPRPQAKWRDFCPVCWAARRDAEQQRGAGA